MEFVWIIEALNQMIDQIAWVVIPAEILLLTLFTGKFVFNDAYTNIGCALCVLLSFVVFGKEVRLDALGWIDQFAIFHFEYSVPIIVLHILVGDFCFYMFHRLAHTKVLFLLDHSVHHSSKHFDYSTNLRVSFLSPLYGWFVLIVPVLLGFKASLLVACFALANAVPFFLHNTRTPKLGWLEYIFNTPSHHRVHHGSNNCYLNKNFAGMLIIWDRLLGTYAEEVEPVVYGVKGMESPKNPLAVVTQGWRILFSSAVKKLESIAVVKSPSPKGYNK